MDNLSRSRPPAHDVRALARIESKRSSHRQASWIKRKADLHLNFEQVDSGLESRPDVHRVAVHPVQVIRQAEAEWLPRWNCPAHLSSPQHLEQVDQFLAGHSTSNSFSSSSCSMPVVNWDGSKLQKICRQMATKASGPDSWSAAQLVLLPIAWWNCFALLWQVVYETGSIPDRWMEARVTLLPKGLRDFRPLSILNIAWRVGAKFLNQSLRWWIRQWSSHECLGGVPGGSVQGAHLRLVNGLFSGDQLAIGQDLTKFFDTIAVPHLSLVLQRLGAPPQFITLVKSF